MKTLLPDDLPDFSRKELEELFQVWLGEIPLKSPEEWRIDFMEVDSGSFHILVISRQTGDLAATLLIHPRDFTVYTLMVMFH